MVFGSMEESGMLEDGGNTAQTISQDTTRAKKRRSVAWLLAVCAVIFLPLTMTIQAVLRKLEDETVFTTPQIVYDILIFVGVVVSLPAMAIVTWMYLKRHPKPRREWAIWPLAAGASIIVPGNIMLASANLFAPSLLTAQLLTILLYANLGAVVLSLFSILILMLPIE